jgi:tripartite-type tricarboxylate transporter receptor subunit TctC
VTTLHGQIVKILSAREMKDKLIAQGFEPVGGTPEEFGAYIKSEIAKWGKVIRTAGIKPE